MGRKAGRCALEAVRRGAGDATSPAAVSKPPALPALVALLTLYPTTEWSAPVAADHQILVQERAAEFSCIMPSRSGDGVYFAPFPSKTKGIPLLCPHMIPRLCAGYLVSGCPTPVTRKNSPSLRASRFCDCARRLLSLLLLALLMDRSLYINPTMINEQLAKKLKEILAKE